MHDIAIIAASVCLSLAVHAAGSRVIRAVRARRTAPAVRRADAADRRMLECILGVSNALHGLNAASQSAGDSIRGIGRPGGDDDAGAGN